MHRILLIIHLMFFLVLSGIAQNNRVTRLFKQTDTCLALQVMNQTLPVPLSESDFLYLMDDFKCIKAEMITLNPYNPETGESFTWLSFPRLQSKVVKVSRVFNQHNIVPNKMPDFFLSGSQMFNNPLVAASNVFVYAIYNGAYWSDMADLTYVNSSDGYKLSLRYSRNPGQPVRLYLRGRVADTSKTVDLKAFPKQNWLGYWLYDEQNIFSALGSVSEKLNMIKHQNWTCVKTTNIFNTIGSDNNKITWRCDKKIPNIKYGDMVILYADVAINNFRWKRRKTQHTLKVENDTGYFKVETAENYRPVVVELKSNDHPREIGAFVGESCVGATRLSRDDTIVVIRTHVKRGKTGNLTFKKVYNNKAVKTQTIDNYYIYNQHDNVWRQGHVAYNSYDDRFFISFKANKTKLNADKNKLELQVYAGHGKNTITVFYRLPDESEVTMAVYDIEGKKVMESFRRQTKGKHQSRIGIQSLKKGMYQFYLSAGNQTAVKRFVVNK